MAPYQSRIARLVFRTVSLFALATALSCSRTPSAELPHDLPSKGEVMVMSYNLRVFAYMDRDDDGQPDDFKPESEIAPLVQMISMYQPDILAIQEIGSHAALLQLKERLGTTGADYSHLDYLGQEHSFANLAVLSKYPIESSHPVTNLFYSIKKERFPVLRGFQQVDIRLDAKRSVTLINVHLKSKRYHPAGQTEMRRNESRLLATHIRNLVKENKAAEIMVCGDFNDTVRSSSMRELLEDGKTDLSDLILKDPHGHIWTHFYEPNQLYSRIDYVLVNQAMRARWVEEKSGVVFSPLTPKASDHRPIYATFSLRD